MEISIGAVSRFGCMLSCEGEEGGGVGEEGRDPQKLGLCL